MNRTEKVQFLKGLISGNRSINELGPPIQLFLLPVDNDGSAFRCIETGKEYTIADLEAIRFSESLKNLIAIANPKNRDPRTGEPQIKKKGKVLIVWMPGESSVRAMHAYAKGNSLNNKF